MKISLNWLTDYVDISLGANDLAELLTKVGLNCDSVTQTDTDVVLELDVTSNRPDWLGHLGVAREFAAATGAAFRPPKIGDLPTSGKASEFTSVQVLDPDLCPRYVARVLRGVKIGPSPAWMVERLAAVGMRSINNVVDVTNYVLMEYSQPLHSFDYDKLAEHRIVVRRAKDGERMVAIDGTRCDLDNRMLVIADASKPVAIAGVMGGLDTEVGPQTTNILLESAQFDPLCIRRTSRKLALMSESNYRFERGVDPVGVDAASLRACQLIIQLGGGTMAQGAVDAWARPAAPVEVSLRPQRTCAILGIDIPPRRQVELLERLGISCRQEQDRLVCTVPPFRGDLTREIDLIEEVARLEGYDRIPVASRVTHALSAEDPAVRVRRQTGRLLAACGFDEAITPMFLDEGENELFGQREPLKADPLVRKTNNIVRATLLPSLLRCCKTNQDAGNTDVSLFELAKVFPRSTGGSKLPDEHNELAMITTGELRDLRGALEAIVRHLAPRSRLDVDQQPLAGLAQGASASIRLDGKPVGMIGMVSDEVLGHYGLEQKYCAAGLCFDTLTRHAGEVRTYQPLPKFPAVRRDLSLIVDEDVTWRQLVDQIQCVQQPMRTAIDYVITYRGKPIPNGRKSVTVTLTYRSKEGTLRGEQVDQQVEQVVESLRKTFRADLRK